ncbi:Serine hydrolase [Flavobacterium sp. 9AF]|uniref:serine hydrolase domain-containing protein n=1 Tax=Flavobacterium sp. 9AF TaxID=2653142 RepID=UPI0012F2044A|nr:serine hydrolase domain-containing protein [Flavobacterium sp. 9AF]VXB12561.1 Serine hydrolase [Flavobacterium sp. 9AF]
MRTVTSLFLIVFSTIQMEIYSQVAASKIDSIIGQTFKENEPGGVFLVAKGQEILYRKAFGKANLELEVAMQPDFVFEIGSMTKQFTAVAIAMLEEQGKLDFEDEIVKFIPDYPTQGNKITIHHLLTHTSGIKDFTKIKAINEIAKKDLSPQELIAFFKEEPMDFKPGEMYKYNNSGYVILGCIIEIVSGQSYAEFIQENIFKPLNMSSSLYASHEKIIKKRASGYHLKEEFVNSTFISFSLPYASGSLLSSIDDLLKWQIALETNTLVQEKTKEKIFKNYTLNNRDEIGYGYGWHIVKRGERLSYEHGGSIFGFKSMAVYLPEEKMYVVGLSNCDCHSPTKIVKDIASFYSN